MSRILLFLTFTLLRWTICSPPGRIPNIELLRLGFRIHITSVAVLLVIVIIMVAIFCIWTSAEVRSVFRGITLIAVEDYFTVLMCFEALWLDVRRWGYAMRYVASSFCFQPISENNHLCYNLQRI